MADTITETSISGQITTGLDGRTQTWLVAKLNAYSDKINSIEGQRFKKFLKEFNDADLSKRMNNYIDFEDDLLYVIGQILKTKIVKN